MSPGASIRLPAHGRGSLTVAPTAWLGPRVLRNFLLLYGSSLFSGLAWGMVLPTIPVLAGYFDISMGAAAQTVTGLGHWPLLRHPGERASCSTGSGRG